MKYHTLANFTERLTQDLHRTLDILYAVPLLANDFQIMMDCNSGAVYHLDFDRFVGGIFHSNFAETFPKRYANAVRTIRTSVFLLVLLVHYPHILHTTLKLSWHSHAIVLLASFSEEAHADNQKRIKKGSRHHKSREVKRSKRSFASQLKCPGHGRRR